MKLNLLESAAVGLVMVYMAVALCALLYGAALLGAAFLKAVF